MPFGIIREQCNDTEKTSEAPAQGNVLIETSPQTGSLRGYHAASSPYLDVGRAMTGMNLDGYCTESGSEDAAANVVVSCVIMSIISQALMVCALNGEKDRWHLRMQPWCCSTTYFNTSTYT